MHLKDDVLHAFLDGELAAATKKTTVEHLAECSKCSARLTALDLTAQRVSANMQILASPSSEPRFSPHKALQTFDRRKENSMKNFFRRPIWAAAGLTLILAISFVFPPVRALAGSFLGLFRVQQVQVISFDPAALDRFNNNETSDLLQNFFDKNLTTTTQGEFSQVDSKEAAAAQAGFTPRLPASAEVNSLGVQPGQTIEINIDSAMMNAGLESFGYTDVKIPADLDGQKIVATIPTGVTAAFGECPKETNAESVPTSMAGCIGLIQLPAPTVTAPDSFPVAQLGEVVLQLTGMSPEQAASFSQSIDWSSTLILPIPTGSNVETQDIQIDGVSGTLIQQQDSSSTYTLIWVKNGILYGLTGQGDIQAAYRLALSLQ
jgi:hypothetical protein